MRHRAGPAGSGKRRDAGRRELSLGYAVDFGRRIAGMEGVCAIMQDAPSLQDVAAAIEDSL
jgi:hypothetical protein